jgi:hypothetical protein
MFYFWFYFSLFLFAWYTSKLLKNKMTDQYWHIPQVLFLFSVYLMPFAYSFDFLYLPKIFFLGCQFPFLFNTSINAYRKDELGSGWYKHLGKYDWVSYDQTVFLFAFGLVGTIIYGVFL